MLRPRSPAPEGRRLRPPSCSSWQWAWALRSQPAASSAQPTTLPPAIPGVPVSCSKPWSTTCRQVRFAPRHYISSAWSGSTTIAFIEAAELLERGVLDSGSDESLRVRILISLTFALLNSGQIEQAYARVQQAVSESERLGISSLLSPALGMRAMLDFMSGRGFDEAALQRAVDLEEEDQPVALAFRPSVQMTLLRAWTGELDPARKAMLAVGQRCISVGEEGELIFVAFSSGAD